MGIIDAVAVDHSLRPQAAAYDKSRHDAAMHRFLLGTHTYPCPRHLRFLIVIGPMRLSKGLTWSPGKEPLWAHIAAEWRAFTTCGCARCGSLMR